MHGSPPRALTSAGSSFASRSTIWPNFGFQAWLLARWRWLDFTADWTYADTQTQQGMGLAAIDLHIDHHPDTGVRTTGLRIPNWDFVETRLVEIWREMA